MELTYHNNRSVFLDEILKKRGWREAKEDEFATFGLWADHGKKDRDSLIKVYDRKESDLMDNKRKFYQHLFERKDEGLLKNIPETFLTWEEVRDNTEDDGRLWFLKHATSTEGKHVWCYRNKKELEVFATRNGIMNNYVIQREVVNMKLLVGYKFTFRVYILIHNGKLYFYRKFTGKVHPELYDRESLDPKVHIDCVDAKKILAFEGNNWEHSPVVVPKLKDVSKKVVGSFLPFLNKDEKSHRYSLMGLDYIIDQDLKPWLIEINTYPFLWDTKPFVIELKKQLLTDLYNLVVNPVVTGVNPVVTGEEPKLGDFEQIN